MLRVRRQFPAQLTGQSLRTAKRWTRVRIGEQAMTRNQRDLSETDEQELTSFAQRGGRYGERARVVLMSAQGQAAGDVARELGLTVPTVYKWRKRFRLEGAKGLRDRARPGQPRRLSPAR